MDAPAADHAPHLLLSEETLACACRSVCVCMGVCVCLSVCKESKLRV